MKILSITAQKPNSTGSGVYLTELVKGFAGQGHEQAVVAGVYQEDHVDLPDGISFYPVYFHTSALPFAIAGMSDSMPYDSTVYSEMTEGMVEKFINSFADCIRKAADEFAPELVICHHLYLVTAIARDILPEIKVCGFCHNTELRQMNKHHLKRDYICNNICKLDAIFAINQEQKDEIISVYKAAPEKITLTGTGYNHHIFYRKEKNAPRGNMLLKDSKRPCRLIFAGKLSEKKGVMSLLRCLFLLGLPREKLCLALAGGYGNKEEYEEIKSIANGCPYPVEFLGKLSQEELAEEYNKSDIFVLPSFCEGMPLTLIEALACGNRAVMTDLPGIRPWLSEKVPEAPVVYVTPPVMKNVDEPDEEAMPGFEQRLAHAILNCMELSVGHIPDLSKISWENICNVVLTTDSLINYNNTNYQRKAVIRRST